MSMQVLNGVPFSRCLLVFLFLTGSCASVGAQEDNVLSELRLDELYFPNGEYVSLLPPEQRPTTFCMRNIVKTDAQLAGIGQITGFADALVGAAGRPCDVEVSYSLDEFEPNVTHNSCEWGIEMGDELRIARMNITSIESHDIEECFLRLAMANAGYPGALMMASDSLFILRNKTLWTGYNGYPSIVPRAPHFFFACGITPPHLADEFVIPQNVEC